MPTTHHPGMAIVRAPATGIGLMVIRRRAGLNQEAVAAVMGVNRTRVSHLEGMYRPPRAAVSRYLVAVEKARAEE